jgi:uncharacterized protein
MSLISRLVAGVAGAVASELRSDAGPAAAAPSTVGAWQMHLDGMMNFLSGIGGAGDKGKAVRWVRTTPLTEPELDAMYVDSWLARRIVEELPYDCTRLGWDCDVEGDEQEGDPFDALFDAMRVPQLMQEAMASARLKGGAGIVMGIVDGHDSFEPVDESAIKGIQWMRVADAYELVTLEWQNDPEKPGYAQPKLYQYTPADGVGQSIRVHASRVLTFQGPPRPKRYRELLPGWGDSVLQQAHEQIARFEAAEGGIGHLLAEYEVGILRVTGLQQAQQMGGSGAAGKLMERMGMLNMYKSITRMLVLGDGETYERSTAALSGIADARDRLAATVAGAAHMPMTRLFGQAPGGLSTDDKSGISNWDDYVAAHQKQHLEPPILRLCELLAAAGLVDVPEGAAVRVNFRPLRMPTEKEKADTRFVHAQADKLHWEMQVLDETELREYAYGQGYSNRRGVLDRTRRQAIAAANDDIGAA